MSRLKNIVFILAISIIINWLCYVLQSGEFTMYLRSNIVEVLITLMAINTATISVIITKLHEISKSEGATFTETIREVKISLIEQIILIGVAILALIAYNSPLIKERFHYHEIFFNTLITAIFIYAIDILRDTGMAIFEVVKKR